MKLKTRRPKLDMLSESFIDQVVSEALNFLGKTGVFVENDEALWLLVWMITFISLLFYHFLYYASVFP